MRCDLHVHSRFSTDSGNFALRRARLPESFTEPARVYHVARARGMGLVTLTDHNTLEGALRLGGLPGTFLSVEVTTRFPEDDVPLHVLVWNLTEEDHRDLQPYRPSVYELVAFLRERGLVHALAHPLYRMGPPITPAHVERMMLLFGIWEVRNGARSRRANELAVRLASAGTPAYLRRGRSTVRAGSTSCPGSSGARRSWRWRAASTSRTSPGRSTTRRRMRACATSRPPSSACPTRAPIRMRSSSRTRSTRRTAWPGRCGSSRKRAPEAGWPSPSSRAAHGRRTQGCVCSRRTGPWPRP